MATGHRSAESGSLEEPVAMGRRALTGALSLPSPGMRVGQYEVIKELGRGGMGAVYAARDTKLGRKVAIKFLKSGNQPELTARFIVEARATARCSHENIVVIHEVGEHAGNPFMVLEYLQGNPLTHLMRGRRLPPAQAVEIMVRVGRALTVAHAHNIVHRDLKPDNIFVTDSGTVKVVDFGIAKLLAGDDEDGVMLARGTIDETAEPPARSSQDLTRRGALVGTLPYMSPEQWGAGDGIVDHQTDVWAVGIILFEMVTAHHPLAPLRGWDLAVARNVHEPMPGVRTACPELPDELADVIDRCLLKHKQHRIASARELVDALEPLLPGHHARPLRSDESPYAGLRSFQESDAHRFFGRAREVTAAVARLRDVPLLGIVGPSGVGKSSFVRAGVVPALKASGEAWSALVVRPGRNPMTALAHALAPMVTTTSTGASGGSVTGAGELSQHHEVVERLYTEPGFLGAALRARARGRGQHIVLFVDQFEELYTQVFDPRERFAFTACLAGMCDDPATPVRLVLSLRSDFLDHVAESPALLAELTQGLFFLTPPGRDGLRDALIQPAELAGYQFEAEAMIEAMLDHLAHTPGALPLLQFAASQLWEMRDRDRRLLTIDSYHRIGGIAGALASHADAVVAECSAREQVLVRALFLRLVTAERTRAIVAVSELYELSPDHAEVHRVADRLVRSRLLVSQTAASDAGGTAAGGSVELVHESLIHSWPLLRRWLDETQEDAAFLEQLRGAARQWQAKGHPQGLLWRGEAMQEARLWRSRYRGTLPELQRAYLDAVFALAARATRRKRVAVISALGFLSALVIAGGVGLVMIRTAQQEATAQARRAEQQLALTRIAEQTAKAAEQTSKAAEQTARAERGKTVEANQKLESQNAALLAAIDAAERARQEAERARGEAEQARLRAEASKRLEQRSKQRQAEAARVARQAEADARRAKETLETTLAEERKRIAELEELTGGTTIIPDVETH